MTKPKNPSVTQTSGPGKGATKRLSAEEHAARKKASQSRKKAHKSNASSKQRSDETFFEGIRQDKRQERLEREQRRAEYLERQRDKQRCFHIQQASLAVDQYEMTRLQRGSIADKMARAILGAFPLAEPRWECGIKIPQTEVAIELAKLEMTELELISEESIDRGIHAAQTSLYKSFRSLNKAAKRKSQSA